MATRTAWAQTAQSIPKTVCRISLSCADATAGDALGLGGREVVPVTVSVQDMSAFGARVTPRALEVDISTLPKGAYVVHLEIEVAGQYVIRADHRIEIVGP
jgi:hypothetical protein